MTRVLLSVLHVYMLIEYEGDSNAGVGDVGVVVEIAGHVGDTRGSGIVPGAADVLWISVV